MKAIKTTYKGPTDYNGSRITVKSDGNRTTAHWDHRYDSYDNHRLAMQAHCDKLKWGGEYIGGGLDNGYVWVCKG